MSNVDAERRFLPLPMAAERLGVTPHTLRKWVKAGRVPAARPGQTQMILIPVSWLTEIEREAIKAV